MKILTTCLISAALSLPNLGYAGVVVGEETDTTLGKGVGGWAGVLIGGAAGGPLGALAAGFAGAWGGGEVQEASGKGSTAYRVQRDDGTVVTVRSPNQTWQTGDQVDIIGNRLVASEQQLSSR